MKYFTEPRGRFIIKIPYDWQYKNKIVGHEEEPPYGFAPYRKAQGAFQISCYSKQEKPFNTILKPQKAETDNLLFFKARMDGGGFNMHLWYCVVEDHMFMAKYIYDTGKKKNKAIKLELDRVEKVLSTLQFISEDNRILAIELDKYEKFMASLTASFDIKNKAFKKNSFVEFIIIVANQIDAYLRLCIVMTLQLKNKTEGIEIKYLSQTNNDKPIMEKAIYKTAKDFKIISEDLFDRLNSLYGLRNSVVHRYIISEITTMEIEDIAYEYEIICEDVRQRLKTIEEKQAAEKVGIYKRGLPKNEDLTNDDLKFIFSKVNDKHSLDGMYRKI